MALQNEVSLADLGKKLVELVDKSANKDALLRLLRSLSTALNHVDQSAPEDVVKDMDHCKKALVKKELIHHKDKEVKLLVATCASEIMRIEAPTVPYDDETLKMLFELIVGTFRSLDDFKSPSYTKTVGILETFASVKSCILMLDLEVDTGELVHNMFKVFFRKARKEHPNNVIRTMVDIMALVINESDEVASSLPPLVTEVLQNLIKKSNQEAPAQNMAAEIVRLTDDKLTKQVLVTLTKIREGEPVPGNLADHYHDIIFEVYRCAPHLLATYTPNIKQDLMDSDPEKRLKMLRLLGRIFSETNEPTPKEFRELLSDYAGRFIDSSVKVRLEAIESAKGFMLTNESLGSDANVIMDELAKRLLDADDTCRTEAVLLICDLAMSNPKYVPKDVLESVTIRLRDNKSSVRSVTMQKIVNLYSFYCKNNSVDSIPSELDWIPVKVLKAVSDRLFRAHGVEVIFSDGLFPADLSIEERSKHWMGMFCHLERMDLKNLERILSSKQRFQNEMQAYLVVRQKLKDEEDSNSELEKKVQSHIRSMAMTFPDSSKAEENLERLNQMKDKAVFKKLSILLNPNTTDADARATCDQLLETIGSKHSLYDFIKSVAVKSSYLLFGKEHIACVLKVMQNMSSKDAVSAGMSLLVLFSGYFPSLFEGVEGEILQMLDEKKDDAVKEKALHILAQAGQHLRSKIVDSESSLDLMLEKFCLEGTRKQAKYAVSAIAVLSSDSGLKALSVLYGHLLNTLSVKGRLPTVLQSLGCIAQTAKSVYETREKDVLDFILKDILVREPSKSTLDDWENQSEECRLKEYALKTLTRSYLPNKDASLRQGPLLEFLPLLVKLLKIGSISETSPNSSDIDKGHLRIAAAKAVLRLSQAWDKVLPAEVFRDTLFTIQDPAIQVRKEFLSKTHQSVKAQRLPHKYVCVFPLASVDAEKEIAQEAKRYMADVVDSIRREAERLSQNEVHHPEYYPEYVLTYLVHALAHHPKFPSSPDSKAAAYESFYRYLYSYLSALLSDGRKEEKSLAAILQILRSIKRTQDATAPADSKNIHILCDIGLHIAKELGKPAESVEGHVRLPATLYTMAESSDKVDGSDLPSCLTEVELNAFRSSEPLQRKRGKKPEDSDEDEDHPASKSRRIEGDKSVSKQKSRKGNKDAEEAMSEDLEDGQQKRKRGRPAKEKPEKQEKQEVNGEETPAPKKRGRPKGSSSKKLKVETESPSTEVKDETPNMKQEHADDKKVDSVKKSEKQEVADATSVAKRKKPKTPVKVDPEEEEEDEEVPEPKLGRRVKVWWPDDRKYYPGRVDSYSRKTLKHRIVYDDGDKETLEMSKERWQYIHKKDPSPSPPPSREHAKAKKKVKEEEPQGSSQKTKSSGKKSVKKDASEDGQHHSDNERGRRPSKANGSNKTANGGAAVEVESSQPAASLEATENNTDDDEPLQTYRIRMKKIKAL